MLHRQISRRRACTPFGRDYTGWTARLSEDDVRPTGAVGAVVESRVQCGQLVHTIDFDGWLVTTPLPWRGVELLPPAPWSPVVSAPVHRPA
ncbi:MAG: hypothetical protein ACT4NY_21655 [Pseudonocardiales bacterium]